MYRHETKPMTASPDKYPQKYFKGKLCKKCGDVFQPVAPSHLYCSDKCFKHARIDNYLRRNYGVDLDWYKQQLARQNNICAICELPGWSMKEGYELLLVVDHDHKKK